MSDKYTTIKLSKKLVNKIQKQVSETALEKYTKQDAVLVILENSNIIINHFEKIKGAN